ncbi:hypothetical protein ABKV19_016627 [Rosa sericea]
MIKSVATSIPAYPMSCFKFPKTLCTQISSALARFWWGNSITDGLHWKDWQSLGASKVIGGLGFRHLESFNLALLAKQAWRILESPNSLWVRVLQARYFPSSSFWLARKGGSSSWIWSSLLEGRNLISQGSMWKVGNGCSIDVWTDKWIPTKHSTCSESYGEHPPLLVNNLIVQGTGRWDLSTIAHTISVADQNAIHAIPLLDDQTADSLIWPFHKSGTYSVRSGYYLAHSNLAPSTSSKASSSHLVSDKVWKWIWGISSLPKIKLFLWKVVHNFVATKANLHYRHLSGSDLCPLCEAFPETIEHILFTCDWARRAWFAHPLGYQVSCALITTVDRWILSLINQKASFASNFHFVSTHISFLLWNIWKHRCHCVFNHVNPDPIFVSEKASQLANEFLSTNRSSFPGRLHPTGHLVATTWTCPPSGSFKINTDATWNSQSLKCGFAALLRDSTGILRGGQYSDGKATSAEAAEAQAILLGLRLAKLHALDSISMEADCLSLISALKSPKGGVSWSASSWFCQIKHFASSFSSINWFWTSREANRAADYVAHLASRLECPLNWIQNPPPTLYHILQSDAVSAPP